MQRSLSFLPAFLVVGCAADPSETLPKPDAALPIISGTFLGTYRVPTRPGLEKAATFPVDTVDWTVVDGIATLHYNLPRGLVGGKLGITLTGSILPGDTMMMLSGAAGTGACIATAVTITCREDFGDLGVLPISMDVVKKVAAEEYLGPVADRVTVAGVFSGDPIGFVDINVLAPTVDDHGGN
ncbi:hypothetical protein BH11MYX3_BH11MYX3_18870 [soil metagenome]